MKQRATEPPAAWSHAAHLRKFQREAITLCLLALISQLGMLLVNNLLPALPPVMPNVAYGVLWIDEDAQPAIAPINEQAGVDVKSLFGLIDVTYTSTGEGPRLLHGAFSWRRSVTLNIAWSVGGALPTEYTSAVRSFIAAELPPLAARMYDQGLTTTTEYPPVHIAGSALRLAILLGMFALGGRMLWHALGAMRIKRRIKEGLCWNCGHCPPEVMGSRCPECGAEPTATRAALRS